MSRLALARWAAGSVALLLSTLPATAHTFGTGTDAFEAFVEGSNAVLFSPYSLLPCLSLGLLLTLWHEEGMVKAWPILLIAHVAGFLLAPTAGTWVIPALVMIGTATATLAALRTNHNRIEALALAGIVGFFTLLVSLEGHSWLELSLPIYIGIFAAASFGVAAGAGIARLILEHIPYPWVRIGLRVAASWLAAMQVLMVAFLLAPTS